MPLPMGSSTLCRFCFALTARRVGISIGANPLGKQHVVRHDHGRRRQGEFAVKTIPGAGGRKGSFPQIDQYKSRTARREFFPAFAWHRPASTRPAEGGRPDRAALARTAACRRPHPWCKPGHRSGGRIGEKREANIRKRFPTFRMRLAPRPMMSACMSQPTSGPTARRNSSRRLEKLPQDRFSSDDFPARCARDSGSAML